MAIKQGTRPAPATDDPRRRVRRLLERAGETYAAQAGIRLADKPAALYQLLMLAQLLSTRISSEVAVAAARELRSAGFTSARATADAEWQDLVDALGRAHYKRYDEMTATRLGESAQCLLEWYGGDLRRLAEDAGRDVDAAIEALQEFPGIGPVGSRIFVREVQAVWPWARPFADARVLTAAHQLGLPATVDALVDLGGSQDLSSLSAALVHVCLDRGLREAVLEE
jgi:endonuclease III